MPFISNTAFQRKISTYTDLFTQSVSYGRKFDKDYLKQYEFAGPYLQIIEEQKQRIQDLEEQLQELK